MIPLTNKNWLTRLVEQSDSTLLRFISSRLRTRADKLRAISGRNKRWLQRIVEFADKHFLVFATHESDLQRIASQCGLLRLSFDCGSTITRGYP